MDAPTGLRLPVGPRVVRRRPTGRPPLEPTRFTLEPLAPTIGAVVHGVDLAGDLDEPTVAELRDAHHEWKVLVFPDQRLDRVGHARFAARWGRLADDQLAIRFPDDPVDALVEFTRDERTVGLENGWHADGTFRPRPTAGTVLRAVEVPPLGGDTLFVDAAAAFDNLAPVVRDELLTRSARHDWSLGAYAAKYAERLPELRAEYPPVVHPAVIAHPATGRATLFVNPLFTDALVDLPPARSEALLQEAFAALTLPELQCRVRWRPGTVAWWDNIAVQHYGANDYQPHRRVMARATYFDPESAPPAARRRPPEPACPPTTTEDPIAVTDFPHLFAPLPVGRVELRNRIVFAGHGSRFVDWHSFHLTERQAAYLAERARGGVGMIIQGSSMVHPTGMGAAGVNEVWTDSSIPAYARVAEAVHEAGAHLFGQLSHLGRQGHGFSTHRELWAPSAVPDPASRVVPHAMDRRDIAELVECYRSAAGRLVSAGFDGVEVYLAHGYLLAGFLSGYSNRRTDEYGGSRADRCRLPLEVIEAVRARVPGVPVGIRVSADEFVPGGLDPVECAAIVEHLLDRVELDYISVSQSVYASIDRMIPDMSYPRAPFAHYAGDIRKVARGVPVLAVGRLVTPEQCEELIAGGVADGVCLVRPLIADPELPNKARDGRRDEIRECISCNVGCRVGPHRGTPIACLVNPVVGYEREWGAGRIAPAAPPRRVLVVGGGPGGLKAAETAAERGHHVTLIEAADRLGGQVLVAAAAMPYRDEFANSVRFLERRVRALGVEVRLGERATAAGVRAAGPDVVVVATGSRPARPEVPGIDLPHVHTVHDAIERGVAGERVVLVDSGEADWKCLTTAERLAAAGHTVTLVSPVPVGAEMDTFSKPPMLRRLRAAGVEFVEHHGLAAVEPGRVEIREGFTGATRWLPADAVVVAWYGRAETALLDELRTLDDLEVHAVGDCLAPRRAIDAIWDGFRVGVTI